MFLWSNDHDGFQVRHQAQGNGFHLLEKENPVYSVSTHTYEREKDEEDGARLSSLVTVEVRIMTFFNHFYYEC